MWTAWKAHYRAAHLARKRQLLASGHTAHSHGTANAVTQGAGPSTTFAMLDTYLDNLAAAATTDKTTFQQLLDNNAALTANVTALTASLASLTASYSILATTGRPHATAPSAAPRQPTKLDPKGYCWTHGYRVTVGHSSATCTHPADGHKVTATRQNIMGGSTANKPRSS